MLSVNEDELARYCKVDDGPQKELMVELAIGAEADLLAKGIPYNDRTSLRFSSCVKAMTLHELDHPGEETPRGIRERINDLKFNS